MTAADPERELRRFDELGTIGYCDTPTGWPTCAQSWHQGRLVVMLTRSAAEPTPDLNSASTAEALADLVRTVLDNLANLTPAES